MRVAPRGRLFRSSRRVNICHAMNRVLRQTRSRAFSSSFVDASVGRLDGVTSIVVMIYFFTRVSSRLAEETSSVLVYYLYDRISTLLTTRLAILDARRRHYSSTGI